MKLVRLTCRFKTLRGAPLEAGTLLWVKPGPLGVQAVLSELDGHPYKEDRMWLIPTMYEVLLSEEDVYSSLRKEDKA